MAAAMAMAVVCAAIDGRRRVMAMAMAMGRCRRRPCMYVLCGAYGSKDHKYDTNGGGGNKRDDNKYIASGGEVAEK